MEQLNRLRNAYLCEMSTGEIWHVESIEYSTTARERALINALGINAKTTLVANKQPGGEWAIDGFRVVGHMEILELLHVQTTPKSGTATRTRRGLAHLAAIVQGESVNGHITNDTRELLIEEIKSIQVEEASYWLAAARDW